jgi:hypothetical protein
MDNLKTLFSQLQLFELKYQKIEEASINSFNIFEILRKPNEEVNLHSRFIYELLNPNGSHKQGNIFLELFLKEVNLELSTLEVAVFREKFNIDILVESKPKAIIIENKIDTQDHSNQISKYLNIVKKRGYQNSNISIIYLTLFEEEPNEVSMRDRVINITYSENIRNWIDSCIKEVALIPTLRETLVQYLNLINRLTHQSHYKGFILEVKDFLLKENNLKTILNIEASIIEAKIEVQLTFWRELIANLEPHYKFEFTNYNNDKTIEKSVNRYYKKQKNRKDYGYEYKVDKNLYFYIELQNNIYYGFYFPDKEKELASQHEKLNKIKIDWEDEDYWKYTDKRLNFETFNNKNVLDLLDSSIRENDIKKISNEIIDLIKQYQQEINNSEVVL